MRLFQQRRSTQVAGELAYLNFYVCSANADRDDSFWPWISEVQDDLRNELERTVHQILGPAYELRDMELHRGSVEITAVLAAAGAVYVAVSQYKDFVESISVLVRQARAIIRRFLQRRTPVAVTVTGSWIPAPAMLPIMESGHPEPSRHDSLISTLVWYLIVTHFAMLVLLLLQFGRWR